MKISILFALCEFHYSVITLRLFCEATDGEIFCFKIGLNPFNAAFSADATLFHAAKGHLRRTWEAIIPADDTKIECFMKFKRAFIILGKEVGRKSVRRAVC